MDSNSLRRKFLDFFEKNGHTIVPSSSLIPDDPSVLLTTAGMQQFKKYYTGEADPLSTIHPSIGKPLGSKNAASVQKSFRTSDIDEVGDETHNTFFEMLGNFSFGGYFKKEAITYAYDFITKELGLKISYVTIFEGSATVAKDEESKAIWQSLGVKDVREDTIDNVFWGPTGKEGPCGPTTEIYCKTVHGQDVEVWNIVFNEFFFPGTREELLSGTSEKKLEKLPVPGVDTGMGFERLVMIAQKVSNNYETDLFAPFLELLPNEVDIRHKRIIADHLRASSFLLADGVRPSNKEAGYILRRLLRRAFVYEKMYNIPPHVFDATIHDIVHEYGEFYQELMRENENIRYEFTTERERFDQVEEATTEAVMKKFIDKTKNETDRHHLVQLLTELRKEKRSRLPSGQIDKGRAFNVIPYQDLLDAYHLSGKEAFDLYQSTGASLELIEQLAKRYFDFTVDTEGFWKEFKKHQEISRAGQEKKFGGHGLLLDTGELKAANEEELKIVTRLHTATHLLQAALRKVLDSEVHQQGSDITVERTRFDFTFPRKLTSEELAKIECLVNEAVQKDLTMEYKEMPYEEAVKTGALYFVREKYPPRVKVYTAYDSKTGEVFSKELCGGPHVSHTGEVGHFKIVKEESSSAGVRRIRAVVDV